MKNLSKLALALFISFGIACGSYSTAQAITILNVGGGGTGVGNPGGIKAHSLIVGNGINPVGTTSPGTAGQVLTSNGPSADPTFQAVTGGGTISTSSPLVSGQPIYATGVSTIASVASSTFLTSIGGVSGPGGASSTIQYNANGAFAGNTGFVYNGTNVGIGITSPTAQLHIVGATPPAVTTSTGTNTQDVVTIMGAPGGSTSNSGSFAQGGKGANINIQSGTGGNVTGTPTTGIGGAGADVNIQAGTGGTGTTFGGAGGGVTIAGGQNGFGTSPGAAGFVALKGGNSTFGNQNGADVYLVGGLPTGSGVRGNVYLDLSPSFTVGGNTGIGISSAPLSRLDVGGNVAIGSYAATNAAPANGLIVSGFLGVGTSSPWRQLSVGTGNAGTFAISTSTSGCAQFSSLGELFSTGVNCGTGGSSFAYPFPNNATSTLLNFFGNASTSQFTSTSTTYLATNSGNVFIGTTTDADGLGGRLIVSGPSSGGSAVDAVTNGGNAGYFLDIGGGNGIFAQSNGGVGIEGTATGVGAIGIQGVSSGGLGGTFSDIGGGVALKTFNGNVLLNTTSGFTGIGTVAPASTLTVHGTIAADNVGGTYNFSYIGDRQFNTAPLATTNTTDFFVVSTTSSNAKRAFAVTSVLSGGTGGNVSNQGFNAAAVASSTVLGNLTGAGQGGNLRNRMTVTNGLSGFNVNTMSVVSGQAVTSGTLASTTNAIVYNAEAPNVAAGAFETNHFGFMNNGGVVTGGVNNVGNNYGFFSQNLGVGLNQAAFGTAENASTTCATCNYAFSSTGTAQSYFAANVGIGTTSPFAPLSIEAASSTAPLSMVAVIAGFENATRKLFLAISSFGYLISSGDAPTVSACGTSPSVDSTSNQVAGTVTVGTGIATGCLVTLAHPIPAGTKMHVFLNIDSGTAAAVEAQSITSSGFTITTGGSLVADVISYHIQLTQ